KNIIASASNLRELQKAMEKIQGRSLEYHARRNDFSKWLRARTLFPIAKIFKPKRIEDFKTVDEIREYLVNVIKNYRKNSNIGIIAKFNKDNFDEISGLTRIGQGSIGGKARGLAFMDYILKEKRKNYSYYNVVISIPQTIVLATDIFTEFMEANSLYKLAYSNADDQKILDHFLKAELPEHVIPQLNKLLMGNKYPLAVRSSSLLEDSYYQPFAGIYATYMIPNNSRDLSIRLKELTDAVKCVYASTFFQGAKKYLKATKNVIEEEKMAVIIQKISGRRHGSKYYPTFSGVARSINDYPIGYEKHNISIANIAAGLGKTIVDGEVSLRFSPSFPNNIIQLSSVEYSLKYTQKHFYALDMKSLSFRPVLDDSNNLPLCDIHEGVKGGSFESIVSTFDPVSNIIRDTADFSGPKILTFANILKRETFPLSRILIDLLETLEKSMSNPIEIEFAVNLDTYNEIHSFDLLQARPIVSGFESKDINISGLDNSTAIIKSFSSLGNGVLDNIYDIVYVVPEKFDPSKTEEIAVIIKQLNKKFIEKNKNYILIGPGRWGTSDPWLGIPVRWEDVSQASVVVEAGQKDFIVQQSQGSHFFHNITTFGVFYFTINPFLKDGFYDLEFLAGLKAEFEDDFVRHISTKEPIIVKTDGRNGHGVILKP
ncbi:MAG: phosphoenolpyruvate synthase, partial [Candidatus Delongbacteria bacterium]|nr:phosphoenolpyruvate synthase [Candidatus Delongbacteria bacterium]